MALKPNEPKDARLAFYATGIGIYVLWNLATLVGAVAGDAIGNTDAYGLDAAVPAAFLALLWPRLDSALHAADGARGGRARAGLLVPVARPGFPVIAAAAVALGAALLRRSPGSGPRSQRAATADGGDALMWAAILVTAAGCYLLKLAGLSIPDRVLDRPFVQRLSDLIPVALLGALVAVQALLDRPEHRGRRPPRRLRRRRRRPAAAGAVPRRRPRGRGHHRPPPPRLLTAGPSNWTHLRGPQDGSDLAGRIRRGRGRRRGRRSGLGGRDVADGGQHARHEGRAVEGVVPDGERLARAPSSTSWWATSPRSRTLCTGTPSTAAPRAPSSRSDVASGMSPRPASARAAAIISAVRRAVPDGASALVG